MTQYKDTLLLVDKVTKPLQKMSVAAARQQRAFEQLTAKTSKLQSRLDFLAARSTRVIKAVGTITKSFIGLVGASGALTMGIKATAAYGDRVDKMSQKIGMGTKTFQEWDYIMSQNGGNVETLQMGFKTLTNQIEGVQKGSKDSKKAFADLGVSVTDNNGKLRSQDDIFNDVIRVLQKIQNPTKKAMLANRLFGRSAAELRPLLNQSADAIDNLRKKANKLGLIMSDDDVKNAVEFTDTMDTLGRFFQARINKALSQILPKLSKIFEDLMSFRKPIDAVFKVLGKVVELTFGFLTFLSKHWEILVGIGAALAVIAAPAIWAAIVSGITAVSAAITSGAVAANVAMAGIPIVIGLVVTGIVLLWKKCEGLRRIVFALGAVFKLLGSVLKLVFIVTFKLVITIIKTVVSWFSSLFQWISNLPAPIIILGKLLFSSIYLPLKAIFEITKLVVSGLKKVGGFRGLGVKIKAYADEARGIVNNTTNNVTNNTNSGNSTVINNYNGSSKNAGNPQYVP